MRSRRFVLLSLALVLLFASSALRAQSPSGSWNVEVPPVNTPLSDLCFAKDGILYGNAFGWPSVFSAMPTDTAWAAKGRLTSGVFLNAMYPASSEMIYSRGVPTRVSTDHGATWNPLILHDTTTAALLAGDSVFGFYAIESNNQLYYSTDLFKSASYKGKTPVQFKLLSCIGRNILVGVGQVNGRAYRSTNGGVNWDTSNLAAASFYDRIDPLGGNGRAMRCYGHRSCALSFDSGLTWKLTTAPVLGAGCSSVVIASGKMIGTFAMPGINGRRLFQSLDMGATWTPLDSSISTNQLGADSIGNFYADLYVSRDGGKSWQLRRDGTPISFSSTMLIAHSGRLLAGAWRRSLDGKWEAIAAPPTTGVASAYTLDSNYSIIACNKNFYRSTNEGTSWKQLDSGNIAYSQLTSTDIITTPDGGIHASATAGYSINSGDLGAKWIPAYIGYDTDNYSHIVRLQNLDVVAMSDYNISISHDGGFLWDFIALPVHAKVRMIGVDSNHKLLASFWSGGLYRYDVDSQRWTVVIRPITPSISPFTASVTAICTEPGGDIYVGFDTVFSTLGGIWRFAKNDSLWRPFNGGLGVYPTGANYVVRQITADTNRIYAMSTAGLWVTKQPPHLLVKKDTVKHDSIPAGLIASVAPRGEHIYPNPAHSSITLSVPFEIANGDWEIVNSAGQHMNAPMVRKAHDENFWDIHALPNGTYFIRNVRGMQSYSYSFVKE